MRALEFIRNHVTFKLPYDFSYHMKTPISWSLLQCQKRDCHFLPQKVRQKISVIITNTNPPLQTLLFSRQNVN